ncbi:hypothetical protein [Gracilimonas tropica]|uniref:hypothetical protein n=1 Tax=Gracilimonas tropica TaxID=454600 RepID=UPI00037D39C7|nr:hypothetical protein [Gracilimonas tropica]
MGKIKNLYTGLAGELSVRAEFVLLGWNVAVPEIDTGTDTFVIDDENDKSERVQVKTTFINNSSRGWSCGVNFKRSKLRPGLYDVDYAIFALRDEQNNEWKAHIVFKIDDLYSTVMEAGYDIFENDKNLRIPIRYSTKENTYYIKSVDISSKIDDWSHWPKIDH